jgi:mannose-6-phosphate isomerase class I
MPMKELIFFNQVFKQKIWGGSRLRQMFKVEEEISNIGECWTVSTHLEGLTTIKGGNYQGLTLRQLWQKERELFGFVDGDEFPLLIKFIDAEADLSIQVHPDDEYARLWAGGSKGKTECWYVLDCPNDGEIVFGHNAKTKEEFESMISKGLWSVLLNKLTVQKGDFIYVPSGTVHALKQGMMVLEIQQSSDVTYRLYDYDRLENGKPRQLHIKESIDVTRIPHWVESYEPQVSKKNGLLKTILIRNSFFTVIKYEIDGVVIERQEVPFVVMGVIEGKGKIDGIEVSAGDHWLIPYGYGSYTLEGKMTIIASNTHYTEAL